MCCIKKRMKRFFLWTKYRNNFVCKFLVKWCVHTPVYKVHSYKKNQSRLKIVSTDFFLASGSENRFEAVTKLVTFDFDLVSTSYDLLKGQDEVRVAHKPASSGTASCLLFLLKLPNLKDFTWPFQVGLMMSIGLIEKLWNWLILSSRIFQPYSQVFDWAI